MTEFEFQDCEIRTMKLADLKPAEYNPRRMGDRAMDGLSKSIDKFGLLKPIVWNERSGNIVGGHQRFKHLVDKAEEETDVVVVDLDDNDEVALNIVLNNPGIRGTFTSDVVDRLREVEVKIGSSFNDLCLNDLFEGLNFKKKKDKSSTDYDPRDPPDPPEEEDIPPDNDSPDAVITCPECKSRWKMKDNEVIHNNSKEG